MPQIDTVANISKQFKAMGKIINMGGNEIEVVNVNEARTFFRGRNGEVMKPRSFMQMIYRGAISKEAYTRSTRGNYWFNKNYLLGIHNESKRA